MKKIILLSNINAANGTVARTGNQLFEHGGYGNGDSYKRIWGSHGYTVVPYRDNVLIDKQDVILFSDRENFYIAWRLLKKISFLEKLFVLWWNLKL